MLCWATFGVHLQVKLLNCESSMAVGWRKAALFLWASATSHGGVYRETAGQLGSKERPGKLCVCVCVCLCVCARCVAEPKVYKLPCRRHYTKFRHATLHVASWYHFEIPTSEMLVLLIRSYSKAGACVMCAIVTAVWFACVTFVLHWQTERQGPRGRWRCSKDGGLFLEHKKT